MVSGEILRRGVPWLVTHEVQNANLLLVEHMWMMPVDSLEGVVAPREPGCLGAKVAVEEPLIPTVSRIEQSDLGEQLFLKSLIRSTNENAGVEFVLPESDSMIGGRRKGRVKFEEVVNVRQDERIRVDEDDTLEFGEAEYVELREHYRKSRICRRVRILDGGDFTKPQVRYGGQGLPRGVREIPEMHDDQRLGVSVASEAGREREYPRDEVVRAECRVGATWSYAEIMAHGDVLSESKATMLPVWAASQRAAPSKTRGLGQI